MKFRFFLIPLLFGLTFIVICPPFQSPDEPAHFFRAWQISEGNFLVDQHDLRLGGALPTSLKKFYVVYEHMFWAADYPNSMDLFSRAKAVEVNAQERIFYDFNNTAVYPAICYLPASLGIRVSLCWSDSVMLAYYTARLFGLLFWCVLLFLSFKHLQLGAELLWACIVLPMSVYINSSISADIFPNTLMFCFLALVLSTKQNGARLGRNKMLTFIFLAIGLAISKMVYLPGALAILLIPASQYSDAKERRNFLVALSLSSLLALVLWALYCNSIYLSYDLYHAAYRDSVALVPGADPSEQLQRFFHEPVWFFVILKHSIAKGYVDTCWSYVGVFGWLTAPLPVLFVVVAWLNLFWVSLSSRLTFSRKERVMLLSIFLIQVFLVYFSQHLNWDAVGGELIQSVQGRYFAPVFPFLFVSLAGIFPKFRTMVWLQYGLSLAVLMAGTVVLYQKYIT